MLGSTLFYNFYIGIALKTKDIQYNIKLYCMKYYFFNNLY